MTTMTSMTTMTTITTMTTMTTMTAMTTIKMLNQFYNANPQNFTGSRNSSDIKLNYFDTNKSFVRGFTSVILEDQVPSHR